LQIKTLQNAHRDEDKLERLLKATEREKEEANHVQDTQRLATEIEMLNVVLRLVSRDMRTCTHTQAIILEAKSQ
jgi:hypothetical protein